jgi:hypothetical protein
MDVSCDEESEQNLRQGKNIQMASIVCCLWCAVWEVTECNVLRLSSRSICISRTAEGVALMKFRLGTGRGEKRHTQWQVF